MDFPILPVDDAAVDFERDAIWLSYVDGLQVLSVPTLRFNSCWMVVLRRCFVDRTSHSRYVDVYDLLSFGVENGRKIKGVCVLAVVNVRPVIHQGLL